MDKLKKLLSKCKCGVYLTVNQHRDYYQKAEDYLKEIDTRGDSLTDTPIGIREKMIETNTVIDLQFYPNTPGFCYNIYHYDIDMALDEALASVGE